MSLTTGLDAQVGIAEESAFGTFTVPTLFLMFTSEDLTRSAERIESEGIRPGGQALHVDDWDEGRSGIEGPLEFEWPDRGMQLVGKHMLGKVTTTEVVVGEVYEHVIEFGPLDGKSLSAQVGRPDSAGTVRPWSFAGMKISEWEISNEVDGYVVCSLSFDGQKLDRTKPLAAANFIANQRKLAWTSGVVKCDGSEVKVRDVKFSCSNALRADRYFMQTDAGVKDEQLEGAGRREPEGSFSGEYGPALEAVYDKFVSGEAASVAAEWKGRQIGATGKNFGMKIEAPTIRIDGGDPTVGGPEEIPQEIPFKALWNGTASPLKITLTDDQAA